MDLFILFYFFNNRSVCIFSIWSILFQPASGSKRNGKPDLDSRVKSVVLEADGCSRDVTRNTLREGKVDEEGFQCTLSESKEEMDDSDWEDGSIPVLDSASNHEVTIEFNETPDSVRRRPVRRATAEDKVNCIS